MIEKQVDMLNGYSNFADMRTASKLKSQGWRPVVYDLNSPTLREMIKWCQDSFGTMYGTADPETWSTDGKWFGAELDFSSGTVGKYTKIVLMFPEQEYGWFALRWL